ncbi:hypothetical protein CMUS01_15945 [Colletotrichum musicola]|uniref:Uncharacterized protein n=1 Tax=Colletotrichum musicola TaxID=2175873 RepID=A0A8H6IT40_9PEZI|nr:hypothetical protein CMUS01_15945 [Colletotrichum musicola]
MTVLGERPRHDQAVFPSMWADSGPIAGTGEILDSGWLEGADRGGGKGAGIGTQGKDATQQASSKQASCCALVAAAGREGGTGRQSPSTTTAKPPGGSAFRGLSARQNPATAAPTSHGVPDRARGFAVNPQSHPVKRFIDPIPDGDLVKGRGQREQFHFPLPWGPRPRQQSGLSFVDHWAGLGDADFRLDEAWAPIDLPSSNPGMGLSARATHHHPSFWLPVTFGMGSKERSSDNPIAAKPSAPSNAVASISQSVRLEHQTACFETPGSCPGAWCLAMLSDASNPFIMPADTGAKHHASPAAR